VAIAAEIARRPARTLFFVRTKHGADRLAKQLGRLGVDAAAIHGNRSQGQRTRALDDFASGRVRVLVATDVAARGIHVDDVDLVVHFDPPNDHKDYLHRSGRTARAGAAGTVLSLIEPAQRRDMESIHRAAQVEPITAMVSTGHPAVREIAESGEAIVMTPIRNRSTVGSSPTRGSERRESAMASKNKGGREARKPKQDRNKKVKGQTPAPTGSVEATVAAAPKHK
jgi:superfamily II DNA/RNA helicase